jgi:hypothetical protein
MLITFLLNVGYVISRDLPLSIYMPIQLDHQHFSGGKEVKETAAPTWGH